MKSIKNRIEVIVNLCEKLKNIERSSFEKPLKDRDLLEWEKNNDANIPEQYKEWLRFSGKCDIYGTLASFFMPRRNDYIPENCYLIGNLIGDGEKLCIKKDGSEIFSIDHGDKEKYDSFDDVLKMLIEILKLEIEDYE